MAETQGVFKQCGGCSESRFEKTPASSSGDSSISTVDTQDSEQQQITMQVHFAFNSVEALPVLSPYPTLFGRDASAASSVSSAGQSAGYHQMCAVDSTAETENMDTPRPLQRPLDRTRIRRATVSFDGQCWHRVAEALPTMKRQCSRKLAAQRRASSVPASWRMEEEPSGATASRKGSPRPNMRKFMTEQSPNNGRETGGRPVIFNAAVMKSAAASAPVLANRSGKRRVTLTYDGQDWRPQVKGAEAIKPVAEDMCEDANGAVSRQERRANSLPRSWRIEEDVLTIPTSPSNRDDGGGVGQRSLPVMRKCRSEKPVRRPQRDPEARSHHEFSGMKMCISRSSLRKSSSLDCEEGLLQMAPAKSGVTPSANRREARRSTMACDGGVWSPVRAFEDDAASRPGKRCSTQPELSNIQTILADLSDSDEDSSPGPDQNQSADESSMPRQEDDKAMSRWLAPRTVTKRSTQACDGRRWSTVKPFSSNAARERGVSVNLHPAGCATCDWTSEQTIDDETSESLELESVSRTNRRTMSFRTVEHEGSADPFDDSCVDIEEAALPLIRLSSGTCNTMR